MANQDEMSEQEAEDAWTKATLTEKLAELGFDMDKPLDETKLTDEQKETLHGAIDMLVGAISVGHSTLEKTAASECAICVEVTEIWNELLKVE